MYKSYSICTWSIIILVSLLEHEVSGQNCGCTVKDVETNNVESCLLTIGTVITVNTAEGFRNAINQANANGGGMTILIEDGLYEIASPISYPYITANNLVIRSASGNRDLVILHGDGMKDVAPNTEDGLHIAGNHVTIADLTIKDVGNHGIQVSGHHLFVHNIKIQDTYQQMLKGATSGISIDSAIVQCSLFEYTAGIGPNFYIGGLDIHKGRNWIVRDNIFKNISSPSGSVAEHAIHFWNNSINNTVERNLIINCDRGIGFGLGASENTGGLIRNNMIYNDGIMPFHDVGIGLESSMGTSVYYNTVFVDYQNAIEYRFPSTTDVRILNNLTNKPITSRDGGQGMVASNVTNAEAEWFEDIDAGDLRLATDIPGVVDVAFSFFTVPDDIDQTPRPQGPGYDIGAHELLTTGLTKDDPLNGISIYPNPNDGKFICRFEDRSSAIAMLEIHNVLSEKIYSLKTEMKDGVQIDLSDYPAGVYFLKISLDEVSSTYRIIAAHKK